MDRITCLVEQVFPCGYYTYCIMAHWRNSYCGADVDYAWALSSEADLAIASVE